MAETTKMELVTPGRVVVSKLVEMVVIPGSEGVFGVLPRHSALLANLQRGIVEVFEGGKVIDRLMIDGGIADVTPDSVTILTERAEDLNKSNTQEIGERAKAASRSSNADPSGAGRAKVCHMQSHTASRLHWAS